MEETRLKENVHKRDFCITMQNYTYSITGKKWNYEDASLGYDAFLASFKALLTTYGRIVLDGVGNFEVVLKNPKKIHNNFNVATKHEIEEGVITVPAHQTIKFNMSKLLKNAIKDLDYKFIDQEENDKEEDGEE